MGRGVGAVYPYSRQMKGKVQQLAPLDASTGASSATSAGPSTPGPSDIIIRKEPAYSPLPPRGTQKTGSTGDLKLTKARGVMHPKPRSHWPGRRERRRRMTTKVIKDVPTNTEMLSSLEGDTPPQVPPCSGKRRESGSPPTRPKKVQV